MDDLGDLIWKSAGVAKKTSPGAAPLSAGNSNSSGSSGTSNNNNNNGGKSISLS